jgi:hypothetical protein
LLQIVRERIDIGKISAPSAGILGDDNHLVGADCVFERVVLVQMEKRPIKPLPDAHLEPTPSRP